MTVINRRALVGHSAAPRWQHRLWPPGRKPATACRWKARTRRISAWGPFADAEINPAGIRRYTQIGLNHIILNGGGFPWNADTLKAKVKTLADNGLTVGDIGLPWSGAAGGFMRDIIYARPGRDTAIEDVKKSIRAAGAAGIPIVEYNFYAHRLEEGYFDEPDPSRGNAGVESFYYDRVKDLPPLPEEGAHTLDEIWANLRIFPQGGGAGGGRRPCPPGAASQRSAGADHARHASRSCPPWRAGRSWWGW